MMDFIQDLDEENDHQRSIISLEVKFKSFIRQNNRKVFPHSEIKIQKSSQDIIFKEQLDDLIQEPKQNEIKSPNQLNNNITNYPPGPYKVWAQKYVQSCLNSFEEQSFQFVQNKNHPKYNNVPNIKKNLKKTLGCDFNCRKDNIGYIIQAETQEKQDNLK